MRRASSRGTKQVTPARLSSSGRTRNAAQVATSCDVFSPRSIERSSSGAVAATVRSWSTACVRDLLALRWTIFSNRRASTGPLCAFGVADASPVSTARVRGDRIDDIGLAMPAANLPVRPGPTLGSDAVVDRDDQRQGTIKRQ